MDFLLNVLLYFPFIAFDGLGIYLITYGVFCILRIYGCTELVDGYCAEKERRIKFRRQELHCVFSYRYEGKDYYSKSKYGLSTSLFNYLKKGDKFTIYINAKKPEIFVVERKVTLNEILVIGFGLFLLGFSIYEALKLGIF